MAHYDLKTSQLRDYVNVLKAGDTVSLTGTVYTARDAAHKKILAALEAGEEVPFEIQDSVVYYAGPTPAKPGSRCLLIFRIRYSIMQARHRPSRDR